VLPSQWALAEEANQRLSKKSAEADELRVVTIALKEEAAQARYAMAKALENMAKAREEAGKAHEDLAPLLARVKELEDDVALVSGQRDALNVQIGMASARVGTLENEVATLKGTVQERGEALQAAGKARDELRDEIVGWQTCAEGKPLPSFDIDFELPCLC
jgi:chromosome segregation ATPase